MTHGPFRYSHDALSHAHSLADLTNVPPDAGPCRGRTVQASGMQGVWVCVGVAVRVYVCGHDWRPSHAPRDAARRGWRGSTDQATARWRSWCWSRARHGGRDGLPRSQSYMSASHGLA